MKANFNREELFHLWSKDHINISFYEITSDNLGFHGQIAFRLPGKFLYTGKTVDYYPIVLQLFLASSWSNWYTASKIPWLVAFFSLLLFKRQFGGKFI